MDEAAAMVPGVAVRLQNTATGVVIQSVSNEAGNFRFPYLSPGRYQLTADKTGFKKFIQDQIELRVAESVELEVKLIIGQMTEQVEVTAAPPQLATADASLGTLINRTSISELPVRDGSPVELALLTPGLNNTQSLRQRKAVHTLALSEISSNGTGSLMNSFTIDGIPNTQNDRVAFSPPTAAVREFRVQTNPYDATQGFTMGATINMETMGGTNDLHGELHEWFRNKSLDANTFFNNMSGTKRSNYHDNRYGVSAGGPVILPGLYDGRNKTFFFAAWERNPFTVVNESTITTVPTDAERRGDLSGLLGLGSSYQIYDPASTTFDGTHYVRQPLPGNQIPASRLDATAQKLLNTYYPLPNQAASNAEGRNNYHSLTPLNINAYYTVTSRIDHNFSDRHRIFGRFSADDWESNAIGVFGNVATGSLTSRKNRIGAIDDVYVFSPNTVFDLRYGYTRVLFPNHGRSTGQVDLNELGFSNSFTSLFTKENETIPTVKITGFGGLGGAADRRMATDIHTLGGTLSHSRGKHNLRFGAELHVSRTNGGNYTSDYSPTITFDNAYTNGPYSTSGAPAYGGALAAFLLGQPTTGKMTLSASYAYQSIRSGFFLQDDWKIARRTTLNLGLRYELDNPVTERYNRFISGWDPNATLSIAAAAEAAYAANPVSQIPVSSFHVRGGVLYAGTSGSLWNRDNLNIMPRIGVAHQLNDKTVLRAGFGMYFDTLGTDRLCPSWNSNTCSLSQEGYSATTSLIGSGNNGLSYLASLANPFPNGLVQPAGNAAGVNALVGQGIPSVFASNIRNPYNARFSIGVQRELPGRIIADLSYVGSRGRHLSSEDKISVTPGSYYSTTGVRNQEAIDLLEMQIANPFAGLLKSSSIGGETISLSQLLRAYPQYASGSISASSGESSYNALQMNAERRFSKGLTISGTFTWQRSMGAQWALNEFTSEPEHVIDSADPGKRLTISGVYELPFGRGRQFGSNWNRVANAFVGGWQIGGVLKMQAGFPVYVGNMLLLPGHTMRDAVLPKSERTWQQWFNFDAFDMNPDDQLSWNVRTLSSYYSFLRGPGYIVLDANASKSFPITERIKFHLRAEAFNATNRVNLTQSAYLDPWSTSSGTVTSMNGYPRNLQLAGRITF